MQLFASGQRLRFCLRPVAAKAHDLCAVDAALPGWATDIEAVAPAVGGVRPLGRATVVPELLAGRDRAAVDEPGRERLELAGHRGRGRLVEKLETLVHLAGVDRELALPGQRHRLEVPVAEALTELECVLEVRRGVFDIRSHHQRRESAEERSVRMLDRFGQLRKQPFRLREPPFGHREGAAPEVIPGQRQREPRRRSRVPGVQKPEYERSRRTIASSRRPVHQAESAKRSRSAGVSSSATRARVGVIRHAPGLALCGVACGLERLDYL